MSVIVIGDIPLPHLGVGDCTVLPGISDARFDGPTETWTVTAPDGRCVRAALVVDTRPSRDRSLAVHGTPNYFRIPGPDVARQVRYVAWCLRLAERVGAGRIEAKATIKLRRWRPQSLATRFYLTGSDPGPDDLYDGPATIAVAGHGVESRVRLIGHLDPIDGQYHWQGTVFDPLAVAVSGRSADLTLTVADRSGAARVVERTPWGTTMIAGVGDPPFEN